MIETAFIDPKQIEQLIHEVKGIRERDVPYVMMNLLNNMAFDSLDAAKGELRGKLHMRNKTTSKRLLSAFRVKKASKNSLEALLFVDEKKWQVHVLRHHFYGGDRDRKGLERYMIGRGLMTRGEILTPAGGVSPKRSLYKSILLQLNKSQAPKKQRYFVIGSRTRSHLEPGIYASVKGILFPVAILHIASKPNYAKQFDLVGLVEKVYNRRANKYLGDAIDRVLKSNAKHGWK